MNTSLNNLLKMPFNLRNLIVFRRRLTVYNVRTSHQSHSSAKGNYYLLIKKSVSVRYFGCFYIYFFRNSGGYFDL